MFKLSFVSRAEGILNRGNVDAFALEESQNLSIFFATNNSITLYLKKNLEEVSLRPINSSNAGSSLLAYLRLSHW